MPEDLNLTINLNNQIVTLKGDLVATIHDDNYVYDLSLALDSKGPYSDMIDTLNEHSIVSDTELFDIIQPAKNKNEDFEEKFKEIENFMTIKNEVVGKLKDISSLEDYDEITDKMLALS